MNNTQKIALNTGVQLVGKAVTVATSVLVIAYLTRYLGVEGYGDYVTIFAYLGVFGTILDLGLFVIAVREIAKNPEKERNILGNMMGLKLTLSCLILGAGYLVSFILPYSAIIRQGILVGAISQLFTSLNQVPLGSFQANLTMYKATLSDVVGRFMLLGLVWWFIHIQSGLMAMIWAMAIINTAVFLLNIVMVGAKYWLVPLFDSKKWGELLVASLPMGAVLVLGVIYFRVDTLILAAMKGSYAVGLYGAPNKILEVLLAVPSIFMGSVIPIITIALKSSIGEANRVFQRAFNFLSLSAFPLIAGTIAVATPVMLLIAGPDFRASGPILQILIFAIGGSFLNSAMIYTIMAAEQQYRLIGPYILAIFFNVVANLIFIPRFSYWAAAVITVLTEAVILISTWHIVKKYLRLSLNGQVLGKTLLNSLIMGAVLYYFRELSVWWLIILGAGLYTGMVIATKTVTWDEIYQAIPRISLAKK